jgi:hypothetical protein
MLEAASCSTLCLAENPIVSVFTTMAATCLSSSEIAI